ncbi:MAG: hypothetical protein C0403_06630 [Desulfobacterium sp.]|nr:hypothetical protein [Desulfobacterium sp.]
MPVIKLISMKLRFALKSNKGNHREYGQPQGIRATTGNTGNHKGLPLQINDLHDPKTTGFEIIVTPLLISG